jgi:hypothetical protein
VGEQFVSASHAVESSTHNFAVAPLAPWLEDLLRAVGCGLVQAAYLEGQGVWREQMRTEHR